MKDDDRPLFEKPLNQLLPPPPRRESSAAASYGDTSRRSPEELVAIARLQKQSLLLYALFIPIAILFAVFVPLVSQSGSGELTVAVLAVWVVILTGFSVTGLVLMILLAVKLFRPTTLALLLVLHFTCGLGALVTLLIVNGRATRVLREHGIRVGLLGAKKADLRNVVGQG